MDYSDFICKKSSQRQPSAIRMLQKYTGQPNMISLGGGIPHPATFPFKSITIGLENNTSLEVDNDLLNSGLQYSATAGLPQLITIIDQIVKKYHTPTIPFDVCVGGGSQDVLSKAFDMLLEPGDSCLIESPAYVGILGHLRPMSLNLVEISVDKDGVSAYEMVDILENWGTRNSGRRMPKVLYTVPVAGNPTGISATLARKREIYGICQRFNILILEDDPYYFLQFGEYIPSYFSMDTDARVLRFDSLSKILAPGLRLGWASGPKILIDRIILHSMTSNLHPSGVSQALFVSLFRHWGLTPGFDSHVKKLATHYQSKSEIFIRACVKHLTGLCEWNVPTAGMFVWLNILGCDDSTSIVMLAIERNVLVVPGVEFMPNQSRSGYVRCSYSIASEEEIDVSLARFGKLLGEIDLSRGTK